MNNHSKINKKVDFPLFRIMKILHFLNEIWLLFKTLQHNNTTKKGG